MTTTRGLGWDSSAATANVLVVPCTRPQLLDCLDSSNFPTGFAIELRSYKRVSLKVNSVLRVLSESSFILRRNCYGLTRLVGIHP